MVDVNCGDFEQRLDFWVNEFMNMGTPSTVLNSEGSRTAHSSSVGSTDQHADQLHIINSVFFAVLVNKIDKLGEDSDNKLAQLDQRV